LITGDADACNDHFYISTNSAVDTTTITGGGGVDTFHVTPFAYSIINGEQVPQLGRIVVTDFTAGTGGDVIEVGDLLKASLGYTANTTDYLRLLQDNSTSELKDIQLQWDKDGSGSVYGWQTLLTLKNINVTALNINVNALVDANFTSSLKPTIVTNTNPLPTTKPYLNQGIAIDQPWVYPLDFASHFSDTDSLSYSVAFFNNGELPFYVDTATGNLRVYPTQNHLGKAYPIRVTATDTAGSWVDLNFSVSVLGFNAGNVFTAASSTQSIVGTAGIDTVNYADARQVISASLSSMTAIENVVGSQYADSLTGDSNANLIDGGNGSDTLNGGIGVDTLIGGLGDDVYIIDNSTDVIKERPNAGIDEVQATVNFALPDNVENLVLLSPSGLYGMGNNQNNTIIGSSGSDTLKGGFGADTMIGSAGDDVYFVDNQQDVATESSGEGVDTIYSTVSYRVPSNVEKLVLSGRLLINATADSSANPVTLIGNIANNKLTGSSFADTLIGGVGADTLIGGVGADTLTGGLGADTLTGGDGNDLFVYASPKEGKDKITDFVSRSDKIGLLESAFPSGWNNHQLEATSLHKMSSALTSNPVNLNSASNTGGILIIGADSAAAGVAIYYTTQLNAVSKGNSTLLVTLTGLNTTVTANDFVSF
jgi:Ca2+-binding RTX toxin-like protein